ncbi:MAG: DUF3847 domain-containing protein [Oscillospiraceae bacterium]|nr:DUF3847 domain-containing protein [Oscillospiraceae bacterium]
MSTTKTTTQKIDSIKNQIQQLENQKKQLLQKQGAADRKARTKRLIERGAILESLIPGADKYTNEQIKAFLEKTVTTETARRILDSFSAKDTEIMTAESPWITKISGMTVMAKNEITGQDSG